MTVFESGLASPSLGLAAVAEFTGPFPTPVFLDAWARHRRADVLVADAPDAAVVLWDDEGIIRFAGEADLTDYHSPLGSGAADLMTRLVDSLPAGTRLEFDSLPAEAAEAVEVGLAVGGVMTTRRRHEIAAVLDLGETHDEYLAGLDKKQRHEVRRKRRRFDDAFGGSRLVRRSDSFERFVDMHRAAPGDKGTFMTDPMASFFEGLLEAGFVLDMLVTEDGDAVAAAFGFEDDDVYYLYNSAFDPDAGHASPGVVLVDMLIEQAIQARKRRFDFLKGDEVYKFRLGASERPLYVVEATL